MFHLIESAELVSPSDKTYRSFPQLLVHAPNTQNQHLLSLFFRQALYDESDPRPGMKAHGLEGSIFLMQRNPYTGDWSEPTCWLSGMHCDPGWIDGFFTQTTQGVYALLRRFPSTEPLYQGLYNQALESIRHPSWPQHVRFGGHDGLQCIDIAQWGPVIEWDQEDSKPTWLQSAYVLTPLTHLWEQDYDFKKPTMTLPMLFESHDHGQSWHVRSIIGHQHFLDTLDNKPIWGNETVVARLGHRLVAVIRTGNHWPGPLMCCISEDGGHTWSAPQPTGLYGEAPAWCHLPNGDSVLGFRGFRYDPDTGEALKDGGTFSVSYVQTDPLHFGTEWVVDTYTGNHYDGGYGSVAWLPDSAELAITYYASNSLEQRQPGIRWARIGVAGATHNSRYVQQEAHA